MTHANETTTVQFLYSAEPETIFSRMVDGQHALSSADMIYQLETLAYTPVIADCVDQTSALVMLARAEAAYRPKVRPTRPTMRAADRSNHSRRNTAATVGQPVHPAHPTHLVIVCAHRPRPKRLSAMQPDAPAIVAARDALYAEVQTTTASRFDMRSAAHCMAIAGVYMSLAQSAAAQHLMALF